MTAIKVLVTVLGEMRKELLQIVRRPVSLFGLVAGPFLVMGLFGIGFTGSARPLEAILVISDGLPLPRDASYYERLLPVTTATGWATTSGESRTISPRSASRMYW